MRKGQVLTKNCMITWTYADGESDKISTQQGRL